MVRKLLAAPEARVYGVRLRKPEGQGTVGIMPAFETMRAGHPILLPLQENVAQASCLCSVWFAWAGCPCHLKQQDWAGRPRSFRSAGLRSCAYCHFLRCARAYSLIEVLIAGAILVIGISGAAMMANALLVQEESTGFSLRAFNTQEQAARLWQLGLHPTNITNILPERCTTSNTVYSIQLQFSNSTTNITSAGGNMRMEMLNPLRIIFHSGFDASNTPIYRTNDIIVVRPTIR
ncbi:MAG: type IV pilus modification PilV family protein [Terrimicrobiaceae bacterium]